MAEFTIQEIKDYIEGNIGSSFQTSSTITADELKTIMLRVAENYSHSSETVKLTDDQSITGQKTFDSAIKHRWKILSSLTNAN